MALCLSRLGAAAAEGRHARAGEVVARGAPAGHGEQQGQQRALDRFALPVLPPDETRSASYVRLAVDDRPGVLAQLAGLFGAHGISLRTVVQRPRPDGVAELAGELERAGLRSVEYELLAGGIVAVHAGSVPEDGPA